MPAIPLVVAATGVYSAVSAADQQRKAANQANDAAKAAAAGASGANGGAGVDIGAVSKQAHDQAVQNAIDSAALEQQLNPLAPQLRNQSLQALINGLKSGTPYNYAQYQDAPNIQSDPQYRQFLSQQLNSSIDMPQYQDYDQSGLTKAAYDRAQQELALGGKLDAETVSQIFRTSAAKGARVGNIQMGRDISARDLGLSSIDLARQRLATAGQFGAQTDAFNAARAGSLNTYGLNAAQLALQQQLQKSNLGFGLESLNAQDRAYQNQLWQQNATNYNQYNQQQQQYQLQLQQMQAAKNLSAAQLGQSIQQPLTGLDPASIANLAVGNSNALSSAQQNAAAIRASSAQGQSQLGGQLIGLGASLYNSYQPQPTYTLPTTTVNMNTPTQVNGGVPFNGMIRG